MIQHSFPARALNDATRSELEDLKKAGRIHEYQIEDEVLVIKRQEVPGQTQDEFFRAVKTTTERLRLSGLLFRQVSAKVNELCHGHGALHPRNIILGETALDVVDAVFNRVRFNPLVVSRDDFWLWGPCVPKGWSVEDWDLVSLLRTAALLDLGPSAWETPIPREEVAEVCRVWASKLLENAFQGDDFLVRLDEAVALLPAIVDAEFELPEFPLESELETLLTRRGEGRVLLQQDEEELAARVGKYGLEGDVLARGIRVWMLQHGYQREADLRALAEEFLTSGLFGEKLVTARACAAAERTFTHYGLAPERAAELVRELLKRANLLDERQAATECRSFLASNIGSIPPSSDDSSMKDLAESFAQESGFPLDVARRLLDLEIERRVLGLTP